MSLLFTATAFAGDLLLLFSVLVFAFSQCKYLQHAEWRQCRPTCSLFLVKVPLNYNEPKNAFNACMLTSTKRNVALFQLNAGFRMHCARRSYPLLFGDVATEVRGIFCSFVRQSVRELGRYLNPWDARFAGGSDVSWAGVTSAGWISQTLPLFLCIGTLHIFFRYY